MTICISSAVLSFRIQIDKRILHHEDYTRGCSIAQEEHII